MILVSRMFHGQEREWTVVIHRNPLDWPQSFRWHIKQRNPIIYVSQVISGACCCCCFRSIPSAGMVLKMMEMSLLCLIIRVAVVRWPFLNTSSSSATEIPSQRKLGVSWRSEICACWIVSLIVGGTTRCGVVANQRRGRWSAWWTYVKGKIRCRSWSRFNENPFQGHLLEKKGI